MRQILKKGTDYTKWIFFIDRLIDKVPLKRVNKKTKEESCSFSYYINLNEGYQIYDTPKAYTEDWGYALTKFKYNIVIKSVTSASEKTKDSSNHHITYELYENINKKLSLTKTETLKFEDFLTLLKEGVK